MLVAASCLVASLGVGSGLNIVHKLEEGLKGTAMKLAVISSACSYKARLLGKACQALHQSVPTRQPWDPVGFWRLEVRP